MKKINYLYFIGSTLMWIVVDRLLCILTKYDPKWLLLLPAYAVWYVCSLPLIYSIKKRNGVKANFKVSHCLKADFTTIWIDKNNQEFAYLCMLNPFRIHYVPLYSIFNAEVEVKYNKDQEYIDYVNLCFNIQNKKNRIRVDGRSRFSLIRTDTEGKEIIAKTQAFADILNEKAF